MVCNQPPVEYTFETREEYEERLSEMVREGETKSIQGTDRYDELLEEYLKFCENNDE